MRDFLYFTSFVVGSNALALYLHQRFPNNRIPTKAAYAGRVEKLIIYPVKSCQGVEFSDVLCSDIGLQVEVAENVWLKDRHFAVVIKDKSGGPCRILSQTQCPEMALIKVLAVNESGKVSIRLQAPNMPDLDLELPFRHSESDEVIAGRLIGIDFTGLSCGHDASKWFQTFLGRDDILLVHAASEDHLKPVKAKTGPNEVESRMILPTDKTAYSNWCPVLVINSKSIENLNNRIIDSTTQSDLTKAPFKTISYKNFRPNVYVTSLKEGFCEDNFMWWFFKNSKETGFIQTDSSSVILRNIRTCKRCVITTVDHETGERRKDGEPLKTLRTYRAHPNSPASLLFGIDTAPSKTGLLRVGDSFFT